MRADGAGWPLDATGLRKFPVGDSMSNKPQKWVPVKGPSSIANAEEAMRSGPSGPDIMHRGMSEAEYNNVRKSGKIESRGAGNVGKGERGLTFFSADPRVAASYAHLQGSPSYVVSARRPPEGGININRDNGFELGVNSPTDAKNIAAVYRGDRQGRDPWSWQRVAASGGSINPEKAIRAANMIARRVGRSPGGSLSDAMNSFSKEREDSLKRPASGSTSSDAALLAMLRPHPQLAIAEPEDSRRRMAPSGQVADLGAQIDEGAHWLAGQSGDEPPVVSGVHQTAVKQGNSPTLLTTKSFSNAPDANGAYRPAYSLSDADLSPAVINTIAGEAHTTDPAGVDAVINNMFNRLGTTDYGPAGNLAQVARSQGVNGKTPQYTGYRQAHPDEADYIRSRIQAIASGGVPDNTNGSMEYRGAWLYNKAAQMHPEGVGVGGNWFFPTNAQPGPYAARQSDTESAQNNAPAPSRQVDAQGIAKIPNRDGSFTLTDQNGQTVGYDRGSAPLASVPQSQPHMQPAQVPAQTTQPAPPPQPQQQPQQQPPSDQLGQADPMSNMFDRMAMMPEVASGYDSPQVLYQPDQARRGGYIKRADGGSTSPTPDDAWTHGYQAQARGKSLEDNPHRGDPQLAPHWENGWRQGEKETITDFNPEKAHYEISTSTLKANRSANRQNKKLATWNGSQRAAGGPVYASMPTNELIARALEIIRKHRDLGGEIVGNAPNGDVLLSQFMPNPSPSRSNTNSYWERPLEIPSSSPAPAAPQTPVANNPAVAAGTVGNAAGATGSPIGTIPMAAPTPQPPPDWNNTLDQALQTNNPTMNQIFGFNYPQNLPSPKPQPTGPVSQDEINALYGFGGGSQMGTGTFQSGGAIIMDALNRARRAKGNKRNV